ncbi:unnamed protein product [Closterium sp. Naga37s-1]|nr:unnamed protein product [Closterium sp. Naga37s-1]
MPALSNPRTIQSAPPARLVRDAAELQLCRIELERVRRDPGGLADVGKCQERLARLTGTGTVTHANGTIAPAETPFEDVEGMSAAALKKEVIDLRIEVAILRQEKVRLESAEKERAVWDNALVPKSAVEGARMVVAGHTCPVVPEALINGTHVNSVSGLADLVSAATAQAINASVAAAAASGNGTDGNSTLGGAAVFPVVTNDAALAAVEGGVKEGENTTLARWNGYECRASIADMKRYLNYTVRADCPHDWFFVQRLMFIKDCFSLPRRRCFTITPRAVQEPIARPKSLFSQGALMDSNVRWDLHQCKSFGCLNSRVEGDCRNCFNMTLESNRWKAPFRGSITMAAVIAMKPGSLRLGLDVGGGTGSFAAHMARYGVTVMTTAYNVETTANRTGGLPYMEAIALRGLIPLHSPHKARLPLYDATLDIVHTVNSVKYLPMLEFEEMLFEWDRVLRGGGLLWLEMFYAPKEEMPAYVALIELLGYSKRYWNYSPKNDAGERDGEHVYLNCVLEKPFRPGTQLLDGPPKEDLSWD